MRSFYLLTKSHCPLCTQAIQLIHLTPLDEPIELGVVDISTDPDLIEEYATLVPVLVRGRDDVELKWPFNPAQLLEFLES